MTELVLFGIVGLVALATAVAMLLSDNPVHSALFLIVTMGCIAFLFLLLNAPFLAMIQITVYTGAIMVLFLFVIMLLGAERVQDSEASTDTPRFRWFTPLAWGLALALLLIVGIVLAQVNFGLQANTAPAPQVRVLNAAPDAGAVNVYANDQLIASSLPFRGTTEYVTLAPGDYAIRVQPEDGVELTSTVTLVAGTQQTLVDYGGNRTLAVSLVPDDNSTVNEDRSARVTFFNGFSGLDAVQVVDEGSEFLDDDTAVIVDHVNFGTSSDPLILPEGGGYNWAIVEPGNNDNVLVHYTSSELARNTTTLVVLAQERAFNGTVGGTLRAVTIPIVTDNAPVYGSPEAIGLELFTNYMLVFQLLAMLLLAAMVGAIVLTHKEVRILNKRVGGRRRVSRPLVNVIASQVGHDVTTPPGESVPELQEPAAGK